MGLDNSKSFNRVMGLTAVFGVFASAGWATYKTSEYENSLAADTTATPTEMQTLDSDAAQPSLLDELRVD